MSISWVSESVPAMGAIKGEGVTKQLGRPELERLTMLVREAAQNSWDAAAPSRGRAVHFGVELRDLSQETATAWRSLIVQGAPADEHLPLRTTLQRPDLSVLFVSDRGTTGLGGPTRADRVVPGQPHDYVSFVLNVGEARDKHLGGGTYGYGKSVFFRESAASTVFVYTRCTNEAGQDESRLVGCALGHGFDLDGSGYTGRHWFGVLKGAEIIDPVRDEEADAIAAELGFAPFLDNEHGTTIAVIAPKLDSRGADVAMRLIADSIAWHLWPKMVPRGTEEPSMTFSVHSNGVQVEIIDPSDHAALREFVAALRDLEVTGETITHGSGATPIGRIALRTTFAPPPAVDEVGQAAGLGRGIHHCCLLRVPELVVNYRAGPALPDERIWYTGVFCVLPEQDDAFANAEPPTHDSWSPEDLDDRERSIVRTTLRKIDQSVARHAAPTGGDEGQAGASDGLAAVSRFLGSLLAPASGQGAGGRTGDGGGATRSTAVRMVGEPRWGKHEGQDVLIQEFDTDPARAVTIEAETSVRVWGSGGRETAPPLGAAEPTLLAWCAPDGTIHTSGRLAVARGEGGRFQAIVLAPPDTAVRIRVREATAGGDDG